MAKAAEVLIVLFTVASTLVFSLRFYLRIAVARNAIFVELFLLFAVVMNITFAASELVIIRILPNVKTPSDAVVVQQYFVAGSFLYFATLWGVKISVNLFHLQLTKRLPKVHVWAVRSLYLMFGTWAAIYVIYFVGCLPFERRWKSPYGILKACPAIIHGWDFWTHLSIHITTDVILGILPFPVLVQIRERRLRFAVCGVYSLSVITLITIIVRAILLGLSPSQNLMYIFSLSSLETSMSVTIGSLPGISSTFTKKYVNGSQGTGNKYHPRKQSAFSQLQDQSLPDSDMALELSTSPYKAAALSSRAGSTAPSKEGSTERIVPLEDLK